MSSDPAGEDGDLIAMSSLRLEVRNETVLNRQPQRINALPEPNFRANEAAKRRIWEGTVEIGIQKH